MGEARLPEIRAGSVRRVEASDLLEVSHREGVAGRTFITREMQGYERELIERKKSSQGNREVSAMATCGNGLWNRIRIWTLASGTPSISC